MATAWYTLVVGILICLEAIVLLLFDVDGFSVPNWYLGLALIVGVIGIILGIVSVTKKSNATREIGSESERTEEDTLE